MTWHAFRGNHSNTGCSSYALLGSSAGSSAAAGEVRSVRLGGLIWGTPVVCASGNVYVGSTNKRFYCIDGKTWAVKWVFKISNRADSLIDSAGAINHVTRTVLVPGGDGVLYCLDCETGSLVWQFHPQEVTDDVHRVGTVVNSFEGNVVCSADGERVYMGCDNSWFYCMDARTGQPRWKHRTNMMIWTVPLLHESLVLYGSLDGSVYCHDQFTGALVARHDTGGEVKASIAHITGTQDFIVANSNGTVTRLSLESGFRSVWSTDMAFEVYASPAIKGSQVVVSTMGGELVCLDADTGGLRWEVDLDGYSTSSPLITHDDIVVAPTSQGTVYAVNLGDGSVVGGVQLHSDGRKQNINSSPIQFSDGNVVVGSYNGSLYQVPGSAFRSAGVPQSPLHGSVNAMLLDATKGKHIVSFRLCTARNGKALHKASIDRKTLRITGGAQSGYSVVVSPDGRFLNFVPKPLGQQRPMLQLQAAHPPPAAVNITGAYYEQSDSWLQDQVFHRFRRMNLGTFNQYVPLRPPAQEAGDVFDRLAASDNNPIIRWNVANCSVEQPVILDTYIPAAMDGQGFIAYACGFKKGSFKIVFIPAIPDWDDGFEVLPEPSKVVVFHAQYAGNTFHASCRKGFTIAAMGGTMTFKTFNLYGSVDAETLDLRDLEFFAETSCLSLKGNGQDYKFSTGIINQLCDPDLKIMVVGSAEGRYAGAAAPAGDPSQGSSADRAPLVVIFNPTTGQVQASYTGTPRTARGCITFTDGVVMADLSADSPASAAATAAAAAAGLSYPAVRGAQLAAVLLLLAVLLACAFWSGAFRRSA